jgi:PhnB protein
MEREEMLRLFEAHREAEAARDFDAILATFTDDCFFETVPLGRRAEGKDATRAAYEGFFTAFPDVSPDDQGMAFGDDVIVVWGALRGASGGEWLGIPPGGGSFAVRFANVAPFKDGLMAGESIYFDLATLCEQAGLSVAEIRAAAGASADRGGVPVPSDQTGAVSPVPEHLHTVTPRLVVGDGAAAIDFYRDAFGAIELGERFTGPDGELIHAEIRIGDSVVMVTDEGEDGGPARSPAALGGVVSAIMATYWEDVDAAWARAIGAGAEVVYPLADQFYGERGGRLRDPFGQQWMLSQRIERVSGEEMNRRAASFFASE